jgi:hypothetical protein
MKLKVMLITRDTDGTLLTETRVGKFAVVTNEDTDAVEVITTNHVEIEGLQWVLEKGIFQMQIAIGGNDASGTYRRDPHYKPALVSWGLSQYPEIWEEYGIADIKKLDWDDLKAWMHDKKSIRLAGMNVWNLPTIASKLTQNNGTVVSDYNV